MAVAIADQTAVFFRSLLLGAVLGCLYDLFRVSRLAFLLPALVVLAEDLLFFLCSSALLFAFMMEHSYGQVRWFILLGAALGWTLYYFTVGSLVMRCSAGIIRLARRFFAFLGRPLGRAGRAGRAAGRRALAGAKNRLKSGAVLLYNKTNHGQRDGEEDEGKGTGPE